MKLTKDILKEIILEVLSEQEDEDEDEKEQMPQQGDTAKKIKMDITDNPFEDEDEEANESLILKIKEELKKYEI